MEKVKKRNIKVTKEVNKIITVSSKSDLKETLYNIIDKHGNVSDTNYKTPPVIIYNNGKYNYRISIQYIVSSKEFGNLSKINKFIPNMYTLLKLIDMLNNDNILSQYSILTSSEQITTFISDSNEVNFRYKSGSLSESDIKHISFITLTISAEANIKKISEPLVFGK